MVYFPQEIMDIIFSYYNPYLEMEKRIQLIHDELNKKGMVLCKNGLFRNGSLYFNENLSRNPIKSRDYKNISKCVFELDDIFIKRKTTTVGSYGGKHKVEEFRDKNNGKYDNYISNGEFIMAMMLKGFKLKNNTSNPNCEFYASSKKSRE